jgi:hypothetical protein
MIKRVNSNIIKVVLLGDDEKKIGWREWNTYILHSDASQSFFLSFSLSHNYLFIIFSYQSYDKRGWNRRLFKPLTQDIVFSYVNPCGLWFVSPQVSLNGISLVLPLSMGVIGTIKGNTWSHAIPTWLSILLKHMQ